MLKYFDGFLTFVFKHEHIWNAYLAGAFIWYCNFMLVINKRNFSKLKNVIQMKPPKCSFLPVVNIVGVPYLSDSPEITSKSSKISSVLLASYFNCMWFFFSLPEDVLWHGASFFCGTWHVRTWIFLQATLI